MKVVTVSSVSDEVRTHREGDQEFGAVEVRTDTAAVLADLWTMRTDLKITRANCVRLRIEELDAQLRQPSGKRR